MILSKVLVKKMNPHQRIRLSKPVRVGLQTKENFKVNYIFHMFSNSGFIIKANFRSSRMKPTQYTNNPFSVKYHVLDTSTSIFICKRI